MGDVIGEAEPFELQQGDILLILLLIVLGGHGDSVTRLSWCKVLAMHTGMSKITTM